MPLWILWWSALQLVRPAFSRLRTFLWFAAAVAGFTVRTELLGVTSIVRALKLRPKCYENLIRNLHSSAVRLDELSALWTQAVLRLFPSPVRINGRRVLVGDGIKVPKRGKKMPGVKLLHQQSESKAEYIMGHSLQAVSVLVQAANSILAVPLVMRIHEGLVWSNRDRRTLLDKMLGLLKIAAVPDPFYFVGDAYYAARKIAKGLLEQNNHLITRVKSNAVAYAPYVAQGAKKRGRPRLYGQKIALRTLINDTNRMQQAQSPVYGEQKVTLSYLVRDLLWRPTGQLVRFVVVLHPSRGAILLMSTDTTLSAVDIIRTYGLRFKIEHTFKQAVRLMGTFSYHFWLKDMKPRKHGDGDQYLHREADSYRDGVKRKMKAYHVFIQAGAIAQGLLQYLAAVAFRPGLELLRFLAAHHPTRCRAIGARRRDRAAPKLAGISLELPKKRCHGEIHPRPTRSRNHGDVRHRFVRKSAKNCPLMSVLIRDRKSDVKNHNIAVSTTSVARHALNLTMCELTK